MSPRSPCDVSHLGQLAFCLQYLKIGQPFDPWIKDYPLAYLSNNGPDKRDVLGSFLLSVLSGHRRYTPIVSLANDTLNTGLLGRHNIVSDDSTRTALQKIDEKTAIEWLQSHLHSCYGT